MPQGNDPESNVGMKEFFGNTISQDPFSDPPTPESLTRPMTFGEKLVGLDFNPSGNLRVQRAKELCAELAEILNDDNVRGNNWPLHQKLSDHALGEILNAQMSVVKVLTLKY